jgi:SAM-dependent methyltransferase
MRTVPAVSSRESTLAYLALAEERDLVGLVDALLRDVNRARPLSPESRVFEVGVGTGWLLADLAKRGYVCEGIELNPWIREHAVEAMSAQSLDVPIREGAIEDADLPAESFDVVLAESVLEHVPDYRRTLRLIFASLKPGGVFHMNSSNRFCPMSGEYGLPLYGWLPRPLRFRLRHHSPDERLSAAALDWNQFTYWGLRRELRRVGFSEVYDRFDLLRPSDKTGAKRALIASYKRVPAAKWPLLLFDFGTAFCCVK